MNSPKFSPINYVVNDVTELVRGQEEKFLDELIPLVRHEPVCLDLSSVQRIDAAGLAALIRLYRAARQAGHSFTVANPSAHVAEILRLVELDRVLRSDSEGEVAFFSRCLEATAA
jgi:anti-anti-sigma factor